MSLPTDRSPSTVVLVERGGKFFVYEPALGIIASADNVEAAYGRFVEARSGFFTSVEQAGLTLDRPAGAVGPRDTLRLAGRTWWQELALFVGKMVIVLAVIGGIGAFAAIGVKKAVDQAAASINTTINTSIGPALGSLGKISLADVATKAEDIARDARSLTPENKEKLRRSIAIISRELDPVVDAWRNPPDSLPTPAKP